jgi:hypothetical protein
MTATTLYRPWPADAPLGRTDAGVDYLKPYHGPIYAIADCVVTRVHKPGDHAWGGLGAIYMDLEAPITVNGRSYTKWYTAEHEQIEDRIAVGTRVKAGQQIAFTKSGWQETGFLAGQDLNSQEPTRAGADFRAFALAHDPPDADQPTYVRVLGPDGAIVIRDQPLELVVKRLPRVLSGYKKVTIVRE